MLCKAQGRSLGTMGLPGQQVITKGRNDLATFPFEPALCKLEETGTGWLNFFISPSTTSQVVFAGSVLASEVRSLGASWAFANRQPREAINSLVYHERMGTNANSLPAVLGQTGPKRYSYS